MVIWRLPQTDAERPHDLKYRLVYVRNHERLIGYDNERGKFDHTHPAGHEEPYTFVGVRKLLRDFWSDARRLDDD